MSPQQEDHWVVALQGVFYPTLAIIGIPSNIITFLIFWKRSCMRSRSSTFYLMAISVADTLVLVFIAVLELTVKFHTREPFWSREPWCSVRDIFNYGAYNASTWLVVVFTAERFVAIHTWRIKARICTPRCALGAIGATFLLSHLLAIPYYWTNVSVPVPLGDNRTRWACVYNQEAPLPFIHALVGFQTLLAHTLPFLVILSLNGLTLRMIILSSRVHQVHHAPTAGPAHPPARRVAPPLLLARRRRSVVLLVTVSMSFVLLSVTRSVTQMVLRTGVPHGQDRHDYSLPINVAADVGNMLSLSNAAINMYLYACTQARFRQEFRNYVGQIFARCKTMKRLNNSHAFH